MNNTPSTILAKSTSSCGEGYGDSQKTSYNTATIEALQEASKIMSGKKKVKWNRFQPGITKAQAAKELKKTLGS